jgi:hypothetical protein
MQESPWELTTARTNVYMCLFIQETSWSRSNTFLTRYRSGGMPNELQPQGACELQGRWIEALGLPTLVLPVNARRWVLADNSPFVHFCLYLSFLDHLSQLIHPFLLLHAIPSPPSSFLFTSHQSLLFRCKKTESAMPMTIATTMLWIHPLLISCWSCRPSF